MEMGIEEEKNNTYREESKNSGQVFPCITPPMFQIVISVVFLSKRQAFRYRGALDKKVLSLLGQSKSMLRLRDLSV